MTNPGTILVTGATGNIGRHVVSGLLNVGADVRAMVRDPDTAGLPDGVDVVHGDMVRPDTVAAAAEGVRSAYFLWPGFSAEAAPAAVQAITEHARRVVYVSAMGAPVDQRPDGFWGDIEQLIEASGVEWTFLRSGGIATNTLGWADQIRTGDVVRWVYGNARRPLIHEADLAEIAVLALTEDRHVGAAYPLTGPEILSQADQVRIIGAAIGRDVRWEELSPEQGRQQLTAEWGGGHEFVEMALEAWAAMVGTPEPLTTVFEEITGTPARSFTQWAVDHADDFR